MDEKYMFPKIMSCKYKDEGMTLRDWFAGMALMGCCADRNMPDMTSTANFCYTMADQMMKEREYRYE